MHLRCLAIGVALFSLLGNAAAGLPDDFEKWIVPAETENAIQYPPGMQQDQIHAKRGRIHRKEPKSIFEINAEHFKHENYHSHSVKLSNGESYHLGYHTVGEVNITWGDVIVDPKMIRAAAKAEREAKSQAALLGLEDGNSHHLDVSHPAAVELLGIFDSSNRGRWPCPVPVAISDDVADMERIFLALEKITNLTHWEFTPWSGENDYILVVNPQQVSCASSIGRRTGRQLILLADACSAGSAAHEFLHALGVYHEHTAANRDAYIRVIDANINADTDIIENFAIQRNQLQVGDYDFNSIMHYGSTAFAATPGTQTIEILPEHLSRVCGIGQREELSFGDVATAHAIYTLAPSFGSICANPDDPLPPFPQCDQENEVRICGRQLANELINGKYTLLPDQFNGRPVYEKGDVFLYVLDGEWVISSQIGSESIFAYSRQGNLDPRATTEWFVLGSNQQFLPDTAVRGAVCDFSDDGAIWAVGQPRPVLTEFDAGSQCGVSTLLLVCLAVVSSLMSAQWL